MPQLPVRALSANYDRRSARTSVHQGMGMGQMLDHAVPVVLETASVSKVSFLFVLDTIGFPRVMKEAMIGVLGLGSR